MRERWASIVVVAGIACLLVGASLGWLEVTENRLAQRRPLVVFALDCSHSMMASSGSGNRLTVAKNMIEALAGELREAELALVSFDGESMVDFPPSVDRDGFLKALDAVEPTMKSTPGSAPEAAFVLAERLCEGRPGVVILITDGEEHVPIKGGNGWANRRVPLGWCVIGTGAPMPVPLGNSWLRDPDTGEIAMSQADEQVLRRWAELSPALQVQLPVETEGKRAVALVRGMLRALDKGETGLMTQTSWWNWPTALGMAGSALLMMGLWLGKSTWLACLLVCGCLMAGNRYETQAVLQEQLETIRTSLETATLPWEERGRLLVNGAGLCWKLGRLKKDVSTQLECVQEGIGWCREALRCGMGEPAQRNLCLLLRLQARLEQQRLENLKPQTGKKGGDPSRQESAGKGNQRRTTEAVNVDDVLGMAGPAGPAPTRSDNAPKPQSGKATKVRSGQGADAWRSLQERRRSIKAWQPGVKPW